MNRSSRVNAMKDLPSLMLMFGVLLILGFLLLVILISLLFVNYKSIKEDISLLKVNDRNLMSKVTEMEPSMNRISADTQVTDYLYRNLQRILGVLGRVAEDLKLLNKSADPICSTGWTQHGLSCYYVSSNRTSWNASKKDCEDRNAHLVVINGEGEMDFLSGFSKGEYAWIGLTDEDGAWKWVDGTPYDKTPKFWEHNQPDNRTGHGLGGGEDYCVMMKNKDKWTNDLCSRRFRYICEKELF